MLLVVALLIIFCILCIILEQIDYIGSFFQPLKPKPYKSPIQHWGPYMKSTEESKIKKFQGKGRRLGTI
jgi:hypothetical protein